MAGLFDTLALGSRSLNTYRKAIDTTGHNLANVNTTGYTRQRVVIESVPSADEFGATGNGAEVVRVVRMHSAFLDKQLLMESSLSGGLESREQALRQAMGALQETLDRNGLNGTTTGGISQALSDFFGAMQSVSANPSSIPERQVLLQKAQVLASKFNQTDSRLAAVEQSLNGELSSQVQSANSLLGEIAQLNQKISAHELTQDGSANDLRDSRQAKLEALSRLIKVEGVEQPDGTLSVMVNGTPLVEGDTVSANLETFNPGDGKLLVRVSGETAGLALSGGAMEGLISARDNPIALARQEINSLAAAFIGEVNAIHDEGFGLNGSTGTLFFEGSDAADIRVNTELLRNPSLFQASSDNTATGNNQIALKLAQLSSKTHAVLGGQTFSSKQAQTIAGLGQELSAAVRDLQDQSTVQKFVQGQRDSLSAVSIDEEMANLVMFQKAFQASARLISMTDEMLATVIQM